MNEKKYETITINNINYLVDSNNNKIDLNLYTKKEATKMLDSLKDCNYCVNCYECNHCDFCISCVGCLVCNDCQNCKECSGCNSCQNCKECSGCKECNGCKECKDSNYCENCFSCYSQKDLKNEKNIRK